MAYRSSADNICWRWLIVTRRKRQAHKRITGRNVAELAQQEIDKGPHLGRDMSSVRIHDMDVQGAEVGIRKQLY